MKKKNSKPEADGRKADAFTQAVRKLKTHIPSLHEITVLELLAPEQEGIQFSKSQREGEFKKHADHWTVKLRNKLDRLTFPELTGGKQPTEPQRLARSLADYMLRCSPALLADLRKGLFGTKLEKRIMGAVWNFDADFLMQFSKALNAASPTGKVYAWLLRNREAIELCRSVAEILRLPDFPAKYDRSTFYRLCREIGLPARK